jgi:NADH-quinone oxidoreductase subunit A
MHILFLQASPNGPYNYLPLALQVIVAVGFVGLMMGVTHLLGPKRKTHDKLINFESGIPAIGNARQPMGIKYFLIAILFVLFDVEVIFFYPYAVNFKEFAMSGIGKEVFLEVVLFVAFFLCGFIYIVKKGALKWED